MSKLHDNIEKTVLGSANQFAALMAADAAAAEARSTLLKEVLAVVDAFAAEGTTVPVMIALGGLRTRLAALNQTENDDETQES